MCIQQSPHHHCLFSFSVKEKQTAQIIEILSSIVKRMKKKKDLEREEPFIHMIKTTKSCRHIQTLVSRLSSFIRLNKFSRHKKINSRRNPSHAPQVFRYTTESSGRKKSGKGVRVYRLSYQHVYLQAPMAKNNSELNRKGRREENHKKKFSNGVIVYKIVV